MAVSLPVSPNQDAHSRPRRRLSVASLAFIAVSGAVLLLESLSVTAQPAASVSIAGAQPAVVASPAQAAVLGEQIATSTGSLGAPLQPTTAAGLAGYASAAPLPFETREAAPPPPPAQEAVPSPVASSLEPEHPAPSGMLGCEDHGPLYCVYEVKPGETLSTIARSAGIEANGDLSGIDILVASNHAAIESASDVLMAGDKLRIPSQNGILHTVVAAETLSDIARRYGVQTADITAVAGNQISDGDLVSAGAEILVPNPTKLGRTSAPAGTTGSSGGSGALAWPVIGEITSYFGPSHPLGIDIALMPGDPVNAAGSGTVTFAGGDPCCSYGLFVIIDHGNGITTLYGHLSVICVDEGEKVSGGERIGLGGYTGFGTGPHLHFEVHEDDMLMDPLTYLP
jgi:murein DD-endopeptidase MepM/ murein hydrolase activator NlpD